MDRERKTERETDRQTDRLTDVELPPPTPKSHTHTS